MTNDPSDRRFPSVSDAFRAAFDELRLTPSAPDELTQRFQGIGESIAQSLERDRFERIRSITVTAGFPPPTVFPVSERQSLLECASQAQQCGRAAQRLIEEFGGVDQAFAAVEQAVVPSLRR